MRAAIALKIDLDRVRFERSSTAAVPFAQDRSSSICVVRQAVPGPADRPSSMPCSKPVSMRPLVATPRDCKSCAVKVLAGEPDHRDSALSTAEREEHRLMCPCVSRAPAIISFSTSDQETCDEQCRRITPARAALHTRDRAPKVRIAEDAWNSRDPQRVALAYTTGQPLAQSGRVPRSREQIVAFLTRKWARELDYRLIKELWAFADNRIAVRFAYEWRDDAGQLVPLVRQRELGVRRATA